MIQFLQFIYSGTGLRCYGILIKGRVRVPVDLSFWREKNLTVKGREGRSLFVTLFSFVFCLFFTVFECLLEIVTNIWKTVLLIASTGIWDQCMFLGNCPPTPPQTYH